MTLETFSVLATAAFTAALAWVTWLLVRHTAALAQQQRQAHVIATIEPSQRWIIFLEFHVQNVGLGPAYDIEIKFSPELKLKEENNGRPGLPIRNISVLKPGQTISSSLTRYDLIETKDFDVSITWSPKPGSKRRETNAYRLNIGHLEGISRIGEDPASSISKSLEGMKRVLEHAASGFSALNVNVHTEQEVQEKYRTIEESWEQQGDAPKKAKAAPRKPRRAKT